MEEIHCNKDLEFFFKTQSVLGKNFKMLFISIVRFKTFLMHLKASFHSHLSLKTMYLL